MRLAEPAVAPGQLRALPGRVEGVQVELGWPTSMSTSASSPSSRSSLVVNLACAGPRRPIVHLTDLAGGEGLQDRVGDVRGAERGRVLDQDAGHVHGHVAHADHGHGVGVQGERLAEESGWPQYQLTKSVAA